GHHEKKLVKYSERKQWQQDHDPIPADVYLLSKDITRCAHEEEKAHHRVGKRIEADRDQMGENVCGLIIKEEIEEKDGADEEEDDGSFVSYIDQPAEKEHQV